jgi:hypothetical protein
MSGLKPTYTNIIKQELEIGDLRQALAAVTGKLDRLQHFVNASHWGQENTQLKEQLEAQSVCYQDNLTEIQLLKAKLDNEIANVKAHIQVNTRLDALVVSLREQLETEVRKHNANIDAANSAQSYIENLELAVRKPCDIYPGLSLHTREDGIWLCFAGEGATGRKGMVHISNHFAEHPVVGPAVKDWLQRMKRWEGQA